MKLVSYMHLKNYHWIEDNVKRKKLLKNNVEEYLYPLDKEGFLSCIFVLFFGHITRYAELP